MWWSGGLFLINVALLLSFALDLRFIRETAFRIAPPGLSDREIVERLTRYVRDEIPHHTLDEVEAMPWYVRWCYTRNIFRPGAGEVLRYGNHHLGPCQTSSRALIELLAARGIASRLVFMHNDDLKGIHSVVEAEYDGVLGILGPSFGMVYVHPDGRPATMEELRTDNELFMSNVPNGFMYGWGPEAKKNRIPLPWDEYHFRSAYYINFRWFGPLRWWVYRWGHEYVDGRGGLRITFPRFYNFPAISYLIGIDALAVGGLLVYWWRVRKATRRRGSGTHMNRRTQCRPELVPN
jgi:hypothetical protein